MKIKHLSNMVGVAAVLCSVVGCAHQPIESVSKEEAARIDRRLVRNAVNFAPGSESGAVVPDVSSPCLQAEIVDEKIEGNRLIEKHREWTLGCDVRLLGIPKVAERKADSK